MALVAGLVLGSMIPALSGDQRTTGSHLTTGRATSAPMGFLIFCVKYPAQCRGGGAAQLDLTDELMATLNSVNRSVNRSIRPRSERGDTWQVNVRVGDCEDYALTKRARLIEMGISASALRIATARTGSGVPHAVLIVRTDLGDYVLDNLSSRIRVWSRAGLTLLAMSGADPRRWTTV